MTLIFIHNLDYFEEIYEEACIDGLFVSVERISGINVQNYVVLNEMVLSNSEVDNFSANFKSVFHALPHMWGFANNFFEVSYGYQLKLDKIVRTYEVSSVLLPRRYYSLSWFGTSRYVGAEWETQGSFLYNRDVSFSKRIERLRKVHKIEIKYKYRFSRLHIDVSLLRLLAIVLYELRKCLQMKAFSNVKVNQLGPIFIVRNRNNLKFCNAEAAQESAHIFIGNSITSGTVSKRYGDELVYRVPIMVGLKILFDALLSILEICFRRNRDSYGEKQPILEMLAMSIQPQMYLWLIKRISEDVNPAILVNFEVKSPYAYSDKRLADTKGIKLLTVLSFDLLPRPLPEIFFGDILHVSFPFVMEALSPLVQNDKSVISKVNFHKRLISSKPKIAKYCYYMGTNFKKNKERIKELNVLGLDYIIRRHPRDKNFYGDNVSSKELTREVSDDDLLASFDFAILGAGGMVNSLIGAQKPFYLLPGDFDIPMTEYVFFDDKFVGNILEISEVLTINEDDLIDSFGRCYSIKLNFTAEEFYLDLLKRYT